MTLRPLSAVVLAAGQGKRMGSTAPKVLLEACGRSLVEHVLEALAPLAPHPTVVVHGHGGGSVRSALSGRDLLFAHQPEQRGTGHAVSCALPVLGNSEGGFVGDVLIVCGDTPLLTTTVLTEFVEDHRTAGRALTVLSAEVPDPGSLGRIVRGADGKLEAIREAADASAGELLLHEINTGVIVVALDRLAGALERIRPDNAQGELYLTDVPALLLGDGESVDAYRTLDSNSALGVNRPYELHTAVRILRNRICEAHAAKGVRLHDPDTAVIDSGVEIGAGTEVQPFTHLSSGARIGKGCRIGPHSSVGHGTTLGDNVVIGAHVELSGVTLESEAKVPGPARLVGAVIGSGAWVGPGVVTEGSAEARIVIGDRARVGAGAVLVAPLTVGSEARIEAGAVVNHDVGSPASNRSGDDNDA
jgi:bifunctional UDP-N-acetylglucosamine pyrophosphorylase/glucosamine-1-phosphate N-acetyltransferase